MQKSMEEDRIHLLPLGEGWFMRGMPFTTQHLADATSVKIHIKITVN
jgi:hypothetical protein